MIFAKQKRILTLDQLHAEHVEWLWPGRIAAGKLTLLDGDPGQGKSLLTLDLAGRLTTARPLPDDYQPSEPWPVVILAGEDGRQDTVVPRLLAARADLGRAHIFEVRSAEGGWELPPTFPDDCGLLRDTIRETGARLVIVDPFLAFLSARVSNVSDQWVRQALAPLAQLAEETRAAILLVRHLTKGGRGQRAMYRGGGAVTIIGAARTAFLAGPHPSEPDLHLLACSKNNLTVPPPTLAYRIVANDAGQPCVEWAGTVPLSADDLVLTPARRSGEALADAVTFLSDLLAAGPCRRDDVHRRARAHGITDRTLERAKSHAHAVSEQRWEANQNVWYWRLPSAAELPGILTDLWTKKSEE